MEEIHRTISMIERTLTKDKVNKRGYNKFLDISKDIMVFGWQSGPSASGSQNWK